MPTKFDTRQSLNRSALSMVGSAANAQLDSILSSVDGELAKLFEDRNALLTGGGQISYTGTTLQFTEALAIELNSKVSGGSPTVISLGNTTRNVSASGRMIYAVINRTAGTATVTDDATSLPAVTSSNVEAFLIAKRVDAADGTKRVYFRNGMALDEGQTVRLGSAGSGSGSGVGDDLNSLKYQASFSDDFGDAGAVNTSAGYTDDTLRTNGRYVLNYDASLIAFGTGTSISLIVAPSFTVKAGDMIRIGIEAKRITTVVNQLSLVVESAFATDPSGTACCVSQAVHTADLNSYDESGKGNKVSDFFSTNISQILAFYKDSAAAGDNVSDEGQSALVGFTASSDGTSFTSVKTRKNALSSGGESISLPSIGSKLYLRFFANKTSGSGTVNLLDYKVYFHYSSVTNSGSSSKKALCLTNGLGSSVNCSVSSDTGKTRVTTTFPIDSETLVYVDGKKFPQFVDSSTTPYGYFKLISGNVLELDTNYSGIGVNVEILKIVSTIDNTDTNAAMIASIQDVFNSNFQSFVDESDTLTAVSAVPTTGQFRTFGIVNRTSIPNLAADLKCRMGVERVMVQQIYEVQNEFGPNGERVWAAVNDDRGLIRFVGSWRNLLATMGPLAYAGDNTADFVEITFYGTGLNLLTNSIGSGFDFRATVDSGTESGTAIPTASSTVLNARYYPINMVIPVVNGLTAGIHTVKIRNNNASSILGVYGFEILNEASTINVRPGAMYKGGKKLISSSAQNLAYNSSFDRITKDGSISLSLGDKGARVVAYIDSDGSIKKRATAVNTSASTNLSNVDHTNEEVARAYSPLEFSASRTANDDFSYTPTSAKAFTLDDGTTTLVMSSGTVSKQGAAYGISIANGTSNFATITFVGTGLDIVRDNGGTSQALNITVDGTSAGSLTTLSSVSVRRDKICSGLPYGTHTVKIARADSLTYNESITSFIVYQPKKPSIPSGAVELADYNVMANYGASSSAAVNFISQGTLRKTNTREFAYSGTWASTLDAVNFDSGWNLSSNVSNSYFQYTFFGSGLEFGFNYGAVATNATLTVTNVSTGSAINLSSYTTSFSQPGSGVSFAPSSGLISGTNSSGGHFRLRISGLPLAVYTVKLTQNSTAQINIDSLDIITPIHSPKSNLVADLQNTLSVGNNSIGDSRKVSALANVDSKNKAWVQATAVQSGPTTVSTSFIPCPDMSLTIKTSGNPLEITYSISLSSNTTNNGGETQIFVNGVAVGYLRQTATLTVNGSATCVDTLIVPLSAGTHKIDLYWRSTASANTLRCVDLARSLRAKEL